MRAREAQLRLGLALIQRALDFLAGRRFLSQSERAAAGRGIERVALVVCYLDTTPRVEAAHSRWRLHYALLFFCSNTGKGRERPSTMSSVMTY
jgi:hypothetical protein